jgi:hypothetical protein
MMALLTVSVIFLRWLPRHGLPVLTMITVSVAAAAAIYLTQRRRYSRSSHGIGKELLAADASAVLWTACAAVVLGGLGIPFVLTG